MDSLVAISLYIYCGISGLAMIVAVMMLMHAAKPAPTSRDVILQVEQVREALREVERRNREPPSPQAQATPDDQAITE